MITPISPNMPITIPKPIILPFPITFIDKHIPNHKIKLIIIQLEYTNMFSGSFAFLSNFFNAITYDSFFAEYSFAICSAFILNNTFLTICLFLNDKLLFFIVSYFLFLHILIKPILLLSYYLFISYLVLGPFPILTKTPFSTNLFNIVEVVFFSLLKIEKT